MHIMINLVVVLSHLQLERCNGSNMLKTMILRLAAIFFASKFDVADELLGSTLEEVDRATCRKDRGRQTSQRTISFEVPIASVKLMASFKRQDKYWLPHLPHSLAI